MSDGRVVSVDEVGADSERLDGLSLALRAELSGLEVNDVSLKLSEASAAHQERLMHQFPRSVHED